MGVAADMLAAPSLSLLSEPYAVALLDLLVSRIEIGEERLIRAARDIAELHAECERLSIERRRPAPDAVAPPDLRGLARRESSR